MKHLEKLLDAGFKRLSTSFLFYYQFHSSDNYYIMVTPAIEQWKWPSVFKIKNPHLCDKYQLPTGI